MSSAPGPELIKDPQSAGVKEFLLLVLRLVAVTVPSSLVLFHCCSSRVPFCDEKLVLHLGIAQTHTPIT
jgi:hypothetical protein